MLDTRPFLYVPRSCAIARMLEADVLAAEERARQTGVLVIAPRALRPADLMASCHFWPAPLRGVPRVAVVLGIEAYVLARPVFPACYAKFAEHGIALQYFHEAHLESDQIEAWFHARRPRRRVTTDTLVRLSDCYARRGDERGASHALRLAASAA